MLRVAHFVEPFHPVHARVLTVWAERLERESGGRLAVAIHHSGELGRDPQGQVRRVLEGVVDIAWGLPGYTPERYPRTLVASLPGMTDGALAGTRGLWRAHAAHLAGEYADVKLLGLWMNEPALLLTRERRITDIGDLAGLAIRPPTVVGDELLQAWGARAVKSRIETAPAALRGAALDGVFMDAGAIGAFKLQQGARHAVTGLPSVAAVFFLLMNRARWEALPADLQLVIERNSGLPLSLLGACAYEDQGRSALAAIKAAGVAVEPPAPILLAQLKQAADRVTDAAIERMEAGGVPARAIAAEMRAAAPASAAPCAG
jgi:TRAP-type C4-dicarboxylate transport system substrate-binding protein